MIDPSRFCNYFFYVYAIVPAFSVLKVELSETISWYLIAAIKGNITKDA